MATGLFVNRHGKTAQLTITLHDHDEETGHAVWLTILDDDIRYTEGHIDDDPWQIIEAAFHAYDNETRTFTE